MNTRILKSTLYIAISSFVFIASCKQKNGNKSTSELDSNKTQYALHAGLQDGLQNEKYLTSKELTELVKNSDQY